VFFFVWLPHVALATELNGFVSVSISDSDSDVRFFGFSVPRQNPEEPSSAVSFWSLRS